MPLKEHFDHTLKLAPIPTPFPRMFLCSLCTTLPLILGFFLQQMSASIFGALFGLVLILNDHFGPLKQRVQHLVVTFLLLILAFYTGAMLEGKIVLIAITLFFISFVLGKSKNFGIELERLILFMALYLLTASGSVGTKNSFWLLFLYCLFAFVNYLLCLLLVYFFFKHKPEFMARKRHIIKNVLSGEKTNRFALIFAITTTLGYLLANYFKIGRGYWVVGTTLIVMLPDSYQSLVKSAQRLIGTFIGVVCAAFLVNLGHDPLLLIMFVLVAAFYAPLGLLRNYWLGNVFIAALILFFLELAATTHTDSFILAKLRTIDIALGCFLGIIGSYINNPSIFHSLAGHFFPSHTKR